MSDDKDVRELAEAKKLPLTDRVAHANWKARVAAYEDISAACKEIYDDADPRLNEFAPLFPKAVSEPNAAAVDKALDALTAFLAKATEQHASRICERTCANIVAKCLSARTSTLTRALEALLLFIELEQAEKVTEALVSGLTNKNPKVVVAALEFLYHALNFFGHRVVAPQPIIKALPALFESKDGKARDKVKELVVELARWMGPDAVRTLLFDKMREVMRDNINGCLEGLELSRKPPRLTRKQQARAEDVREQVVVGSGAAGNGGGAAAAVEEEMPAEADPYDFVEPKKILQELKSDNFWDKLEEKKWTERRDAVLLLKGLADTPRIASGDYGDLMRELRKLISKDSNVVVVAESINCCGVLAKGLRKDYSSWARNLAGLLLEKFKEKNSNVGNAVATALTFMHKYCWSLQEVVEELTEAMGHANPKVKEDTYKWLTGAVSQEPKANLKQLVAPLMGAAAKGAEEAAPALREAAMGFMAAFTVRFGNTAILEKFGAKLDDSRKKKLQDMVAEAMGGGGAAAAASAAPTPAATASAPPAARSSGPAINLKSRLGTTTARPATAAKPASAAAGAGSSGGGGPIAASGGGGGSKKAAGGGDGDDEASLAAGTLSRDQAVAALTDLVGEGTVKELQDDQWKVRLDAMERLVSFVGEPGVAASNGSTIVQAVSHVPGWGEKNFQVMAKVLEVLRITAAGCLTFGKRDAFTCIGGIIDKVADLKLKQPSFDTLTSFAEAVGPQFVMAQLHKKAAAHKNPKVQSEAINWIARAILDFGLAGTDVRALLDWAKEDLGSANAGVRNSAIQLLGVMYRFLGPALGDMIRADVKPALMTAIDGEFAKNADLPKPEPTRVSRAAAPARGGAGGGKGGAKGSAGGGGGGAAGGGSTAAGGFDPDDLLPRTDISALITGELVAQLGSSNWKERKAGLDAIETILTQAGNRIQPQTGDLLPELKKRMADSNKNLTTQALTVLGRVAKAMGRAIDRQGRPLLAPAVKNITDQKQTVRSAVTEMLDAWVGVTSASCVMPDLMDFYVSSKITADGKAETLKWLASLVSGGKVSDCVPDALRAGAMGSADKAAEVRDAASKLMTALVEAVGAAELGAAAQSLDAASRKPAMEAISKITGAPVAAAASFGAAAAMPAGKTAASSVARSSTTSLRASTASVARSTTAAGTASRPTTAKAGTVSKSTLGSVKAAAAAADTEPLLMPDNRKEDRAKKGRFRPAKLQIMPDEPQTLEAEFSPMLGPALRAAAFSKDFKKHCEAADMLTRALPHMYDEVIAIVDLLFRWSTLRILESNTASLVKVLEMLKLLLDMMIERGYRISEYEAKLILPAVVEKSGHNQDKLKAEHRELLKRFALVHPPAKIVTYVKDGLESKNSKTRVVCLDEIAAIVERTGPVIYRGPSGASGRPASGAAANDSLMAAVARLVAERDTAVRAACLGVVEVVYCIEGQAIWDYVGRLTDQQKSLLEERMKAVGNRLARSGNQPGYRAAEYGLPTQLAQQDDPMVVSPVAANPTPRRPPSPMRRSGIGAGALAASTAATASPGGRGGLMDSFNGRLPAAAPAAPPPVMAPATSDSPPQVLAAPEAAAYDTRRVNSPMMSRFGSFNMGASQPVAASADPGVLVSLEGPDEEATMRNWVLMHDRLQSEDWDAATQAMKLLCYSYMEIDKHNPHVVALLMDRRNADELVHLLSQRIEHSLAEAAASTMCLPNGPTYNARACKYSVNALMNLCNVTSLTTGLTDSALQRLCSTLIACLIDARLRQVPDGDGLLKAVNMLIMKLLEHASRPGLFGGFIHCLRTPNPRIFEMLHPATAGPDGGAAEMLLRWNDMVVKCLIKMTKQLGALMSTINVGDVLVHVHRYMQDLGTEEVRRRSSTEDKPLRMVKTMLHELCKHRGYDIYKDVEAMPGVTESMEEMVMMPYIRLNLDTLHRAGAPLPGAGAAATLMASAAAPRPVAAPNADVASTSGTVGAALPRARAMPAAAPVVIAAGAPAALSKPVAAPVAAEPVLRQQQPQQQAHVLAPLSTNAMPPLTASTVAQKLSNMALSASSAVPAQPAASQAAEQSTATAPGKKTAINLEPSSDEFTRPCSDDQEARNILAAIFKRIGDKAQSDQAIVDMHHFIEANPTLDVLNQMLNQVSPYFKTYLQRGLSKVRLQLQHAASSAAVATEQSSGSPGGATGKASDGGGGTSGSSWGTPDDSSGPATNRMTIADKLAASEARPHSPASPGRLRGIGNLDELRNRMNNLSTNLHDLPVRSSASVTVQGGVSQDLLDLQERMKKIQSMKAAAGSNI